jgi:hypothetical protein
VKNDVKSSFKVLTSDGSRILCTIDSESIISSLGLSPITPECNSFQFSKLTSLEAIKNLNLEELTSFMSKILKPGVIETQDMFPYDLSSFLDPIQAIFSLLSQVLGSDSDQIVIEVIVRTLILVSQFTEPKVFRYEQFFVERITSQLENFNNSGKVFRYQTLWILIVINNNLQALQQTQPLYFTDDVNLSERNSTITYYNFMDKVMSSLYKLIYGMSLPRFSEEMKAHMHSSSEPVGDWLLYKEFIVLKIYGFEDEPYRVRVFLTKRIFVLEFLRQRLQVEIEIFLSHKKASNMKFKYTMEPFVVNTTSSLSIIQNILKTMNFQFDKKLKYDPKHIISQRKTTSRMGTYEHKHDESLALMANKSYIEDGADMTGDEQEVDKGSEEQTMVEFLSERLTSSVK